MRRHCERTILASSFGAATLPFYFIYRWLSKKNGRFISFFAGLFLFAIALTFGILAIKGVDWVSNELFAPVPQKEYSLEHGLAIVNAGHMVNENDISIKRFRYLLSSLSETTGYPREKIADMAAKTRDLIREDYGREVKIIDLMEAANKAEAIKTKSIKLEEYWALYGTFAQ